MKHVTTNSNYYGAQDTEYNILGLCYNGKATLSESTSIKQIKVVWEEMNRSMLEMKSVEF